MSTLPEPTPTTTAAAPAPQVAPTVEPSSAAAVDSNEPAKPQPGATPVAPTAAATAEPTQTPVAPTPTVTATEKSVEEDNSEEPQNALTRKFTDAEWKAVKELRKSIPEILAEGYPDKADAKTTTIKLWGVTIDPSGPKDARVSVILVKFLRARNLSVRDARDMMVATLRWRDEFKVEEAMNEQFPEEIFGQLGYVYGHDKEGRPVTYNLYGANKDLKAVFGDVQRFLRWRVKLMEESITYLDFENIDQMVQIHDYEGVSLSSRDANSKNAASEATSIFQSHYPELLARKFFVNVPSLLTWIFWIFKPLISAQTLAKMSVVGSGPHAISKALLPVIDSKELPMRYGGEAAGF